MTSVATAPRLRSPGGPRDRRTHPDLPSGAVREPGRATLEDRITGLWTQLVEAGAGECPVCGHGIAAGRACDGCGSELS